MPLPRFLRDKPPYPLRSANPVILVKPLNQGRLENVKTNKLNYGLAIRIIYIYIHIALIHRTILPNISLKISTKFYRAHLNAKKSNITMLA